jgi:two-component system OmpR family response regulator
MSERTADMRRVLIVDDEASITDAVATALRYEGFDTCEIDSGRAPSPRSMSSGRT